MKKSSYMPHVFEHQAPAILNQAAAIQDQWYTVLDTTRNVRIYVFYARMDTADETIEGRITVDGQTILVTAINLTAGTTYFARRAADPTAETLYWDNVMTQKETPFLLEGRSILIEIRKTTAAGANNLRALVAYGTK